MGEWGDGGLGNWEVGMMMWIMNILMGYDLEDANARGRETEIGRGEDGEKNDTPRRHTMGARYPISES